MEHIYIKIDTNNRNFKSLIQMGHECPLSSHYKILHPLFFLSSDTLTEKVREEGISKKKN